jgi:hypothetical protein
MRQIGPLDLKNARVVLLSLRYHVMLACATSTRLCVFVKQFSPVKRIRGGLIDIILDYRLTRVNCDRKHDALIVKKKKKTVNIAPLRIALRGDLLRFASNVKVTSSLRPRNLQSLAQVSPFISS